VRPPLTVLIAPDSFKGSLTSVEVAHALADGWAVARPDDTLLRAPLGDGGEGTIQAVADSGGWTWSRAQVTGLRGDRVSAGWLRSDDGGRAYVEMAQASGLSLVALDQRDPMGFDTRGTGELLRAVLDAGCRRIVLGIGGSATTDGGRGVLRALGSTEDAGGVDLGGLDPRLAETELVVACDVTNPLLGPHGAAATYGPQKGATPDQVTKLDDRLAAWADRLEAAAARRERDTPGAGAAGGLGFALLAIAGRFRSFALRPGIELVMDATDFTGKLARAGLVITGEGRIDAQTAFGKTALGVARRAAEAGVPCVAVGGGVDPAGAEALAAVRAVAVPVAEGPGSIETAMAAGAAPLRRCGERIARLISIA
jgi:glycerate kinase